MTKAETTEPDEHVMKTFKSKFTLNNYGKMSLSELPHLKLARNMMDKSRQVLEIGCAFGFTTKILLQDGFQVIANDLEPKHLNELELSIESDEMKSRLTLKPGDQSELDFDENSLAGVLSCNVIHFLEGQQIRDLFHRAFKWLAPKGVLVLSCISPNVFKMDPKNEKSIQRFQDFYKDLNRNKIEWPGNLILKEVIEDEIILSKNPAKLHCISAEQMVREAVLAGFNIFKVEHFNETANGYIEINDATSFIVSIICIKEVY
jgi:SAM-dependent methyltransferase